MNVKIILGVIITITLGTTAITTTPLTFRSADAKVMDHLDAPPAISGNNVYVAWGD